MGKVIEGGWLRLYLVQHAEAKPQAEDPARPLSEKGLVDIRRVANFIKAKGIKVSKIFHSGKLRAKQTAEALAEGISSAGGVEQAEGLAPLDDPGIWANRLKEEFEDLVLVGHLPHLSKLAGLLLAGDPERKVVEFRNGGVVCLERDEDGNWSVGWVLTPELLAAK
jgi:phosphohistidine phosphatase